METFLDLDALSILNGINDGVVIVNGQGVTIWVNNSWDRITGLHRENVLYKTMYEVVEEGFYDCSVTGKVLANRCISSVYQKTKAGKLLISTGTPIFDDHQAIRYIIICMRDITELTEIKNQLAETHRLSQKYIAQISELKKNALRANIVAESKAMRDLLDLAEKVAVVDSTLLITGESGVGKEVLAKYIHDCSPKRSESPYVKINCGAIPAHLLESELFGYEGGAFTGAHKTGKAGLYEVADGGTLFLDEIGEMPLELQAKLLHVLQDNKIMRVGGTKPRCLDVRVIAATNRELKELVQAKAFRADLFYRLNVVPLHIPPLQQRREDIIPLAAFFLNQYNQKYGMKKIFSNALLDQMLLYPWPGNIRELSNTIERMTVTSAEDLLIPDNFGVTPPDYNTSFNDHPVFSEALNHPSGKLEDIVALYEYRMVESAVSQYGSQVKAAEALGISLSTLARKLRWGRSFLTYLQK